MTRPRSFLTDSKIVTRSWLSTLYANQTQTGSRTLQTLIKRGLTKQEAADYCGCNSLSAFDRWVQKGLIPRALPGTNRWDRKALDAALDRASGLVTESAQELTPYQRWKAENARKTQAA